MEPPSPARLYATLIGAVLVVLGIVGFFDDLSWLNFLYVGSGALGLLLAGWSAREYALWLGALYTLLAVWGFAIGSGEEILGHLPVSDANDWLNLAIGLLGLSAAAGTAKLKARAQPAAKRP